MLPRLSDPKVHEDSEAYRMGAIRECFEESGILLAKPDRAGDIGAREGVLLDVGTDEREAGRKAVHGGRTQFSEWVASKGGVPDVKGLIPFTRWLTPKSVKKRYTTQMYLYLLPLESPQDLAPAQIPTSDGGIEHTEAVFDYAGNWLQRSRAGEIVLFPPQVFLLTQIAPFLETPPDDSFSSVQLHRAWLERQRTRLTAFVSDTKENPSWVEKCISPRPVRKMGKKVVMSLDYAGDEAQGANRKGDMQRLMLWSLEKGEPTGIEVCDRREIEEVIGASADQQKGKL